MSLCCFPLYLRLCCSLLVIVTFPHYHLLRFILDCCSAMFTWTNLLVVVVELDGQENEALDLVPLVTNVVLEEHYLIVGVVVVVDPGVIPINSRGEKQRMHLRDGFLADQLDPIYVAYNMWGRFHCGIQHMKEDLFVTCKRERKVSLWHVVCGKPTAKYSCEKWWIIICSMHEGSWWSSLRMPG